MTYIVDKSEWILTFTGQRFYPLQPQVQDIDIRDVAHALSLICRFTGHVREFYSVAQHCVIASQIVPPEHALAALLHDASEAYICDLARPVKCSAIMEPYRAAEAVLEQCVDERFAIDTHHPTVREADLRLLFTERRDLMHPNHWVLSPEELEHCLPYKLSGWISEFAETAFLDRYHALTR